MYKALWFLAICTAVVLVIIEKRRRRQSPYSRLTKAISREFEHHVPCGAASYRTSVAAPSDRRALELVIIHILDNLSERLPWERNSRISEPPHPYAALPVAYPNDDLSKYPPEFIEGLLVEESLRIALNKPERPAFVPVGTDQALETVIQHVWEKIEVFARTQATESMQDGPLKDAYETICRLEIPLESRKVFQTYLREVAAGVISRCIEQGSCLMKDAK
ncbi:MAG: hypothetical protein ACLPWF_15860 [Bryobacteraceae bacterium]